MESAMYCFFVVAIILMVIFKPDMTERDPR